MDCVQCGNKMIFRGEFINGLGTPRVCDNPKCPNYALLALSVDEMPSE